MILGWFEGMYSHMGVGYGPNSFKGSAVKNPEQCTKVWFGDN